MKIDININLLKLFILILIHVKKCNKYLTCFLLFNYFFNIMYILCNKIIRMYYNL